MNSTNRGLNRAVIALVGLVLMAAGTIAVLIGLVPAVRDGWRSGAPGVFGTVTGWLRSTPLSDTGSSWLWVALIAVLVLAIILLLAFVLRQGHGRTGQLLNDSPTEHGTTVIDARVAEQAMQGALDERSELVSSHVSASTVRGRTVLDIKATARRGVSPKDVTTMVEESLRALDALIGREIPALLQISGGFRARTSKATRVQ